MSGDDVRSFATRLHDHSETYETAVARLSSGTSFPGSPVTGELCFRTDVFGGILFRWDGSYWYSVQSFRTDFLAAENISVSTSGGRNPLPSGWDVLVTVVHAMFRSSATLDGSNYWQADLMFYDNAGANTLGAPVDNSTKTADSWEHVTGVVNVPLASSGSTRTALYGAYNKIGSPGNAYITLAAEYKLRSS